jgi:hypothetical protein
LIGTRFWVLVTLLALSLAAGCGRSGETDSAQPAQIIQPADSPDPTLTPDIENAIPASVCPTARGIGTVSPAFLIYSITCLVNGIEQIMLQNNMLQAVSGDEVQIREVIICASPISGDGGQACVDFAPIDESGQEIRSEHKGTDTVSLTPGPISISGLNFTWTVGENWSGFYALLNHWTPTETQDLDCASGGCERDDWLSIKFQ